jgi:hypothetical protein
MAPPSYLYLMVAVNISVYLGDIQVAAQSVTSASRDTSLRGSIASGKVFGPGFPAAANKELGGRAHVKVLSNLAGGAAVAATAVSAALWGAGMASAAPDVVGDTYSDAATAIEQQGGTPVVATRVGSGADEGDCIVTNAWDASFVREGESAGGEVMVALNCNGDVASAGKPGNSAASPAGREAKAAQEEAATAEEEQLEGVSTPDE